MLALNHLETPIACRPHTINQINGVIGALNEHAMGLISNGCAQNAFFHFFAGGFKTEQGKREL